METAKAVRLGTRGITRRFGRVVANDRIDFAAAPGTIHAIVGGNGAGKTTLMRILQGLERPDEGDIIVDDQAVRFANPAESFAHGVGMVHQEFMLVPDLTLLENLILGREPMKRGLIDHAAALAAARALEKQAGVTLDWDVKVAQAPVHLRQILEILRLLYRGADVLILDEPTAVLAPQQVQDLLALLRKLRSEGRTIVFISHKLDEVLAIADRITVLRAGRAVASTAPHETNAAQLAQLMVGEPVDHPHRTAAKSDASMPVLAVRNLAALDSRGVRRLLGIDLDVRRGEIVGIAGVSGSGQDELVAAIVGLRRVAAGTVNFDNADATYASVAARRKAGIGYLSADRAYEGLCGTATIRDNAIAGRHRETPFAQHGVLQLQYAREYVSDLLARFAVVYGADTDPVRSLSGGNQQRVAIARELARAPKLLIAAQPTRGVDIAGIAAIHRQILAYRDAGGAVLLVSEELEELLALSDRIVVLHHGMVSGELAGSHTDLAQIGKLMLGQAA
ncbi:MAG TPA: ABC transporter ATP-binding protein [Magnetospirillaceae bacterium]|jgi:simple sugar transport system ATP-binding protein